MTLSEIAQIHEGRCFTAPGYPPHKFNPMGALLRYWDGRWDESRCDCSHSLARTDWEFCPDPSPSRSDSGGMSGPPIKSYEYYAEVEDVAITPKPPRRVERPGSGDRSADGLDRWYPGDDE